MPEISAERWMALEGEARRALAAHPVTQPLADARFTVEAGGLSNHAWRVDGAEASCFVRLSPPDSARLGVDRRSECRLLARVAEAGLAPTVVRCDPERRLLVTRHLTGGALGHEAIHERALIESVAAALRTLHALSVPAEVQSVDFAAQAISLERQCASWRPSDEVLRIKADFAFRVLARSGRRPTLCHNDLHHLNLVRAEGRLWLVDWEYGGVGDPIYDFASFLCQHDCSAQEREWLSAAYGSTAFAAGQLEAACWAFDYVQWLWYRAYPGSGPADPLYTARAEALERRLHAGAPA